jgi:hypothetical protein
VVSFRSEQKHSKFTTPVEVRGSNGKVLSGSATYDLEPIYPTFALFLTNEEALLLRISKGEPLDDLPVFTRIGTAFFYSHGGESAKSHGPEDKATGGIRIKEENDKYMLDENDAFLAKLLDEKMNFEEFDDALDNLHLVKADGSPQLIVIR